MAQEPIREHANDGRCRVNPVEIIRRLQATSARTEKEQILIDAWMTGCVEFFRGARLAYDTLMPFYVKKVAEIVESDEPHGLIDGEYGWAEFEELATKLHRRQLTGHAARDAINDAALVAPIATWNEFYRRILLKDLRAGVEESTINKVLDKLASAYPEAAAHKVPVFGCQLAHDAANHEKKLRGSKMLDAKLDGVRLLTFLDKTTGLVTQRTRNGKLNENFPHITDALTPLLAKLPTSLVLEGEIVSRSFQELMTLVNRKSKLDTSDAKLALFDIVVLDDFRLGHCAMPQRDRHTVLCGFIPDFEALTKGTVYVLPKQTVDLDTPEGQIEFARFNKEMVAAGYEGIMIKDPESPYQGKRSVAWLKAKPFFTTDLTIVGIEPGEPGTKYADVVGALVCEGEEDGKRIRVNVGSGLSDEQRHDFWRRREELIGFIAEVRADVLTKEQDSDVWSLRFPRFKALRGTERGEKL